MSLHVSPSPLDETDERIIGLLQEDGRQTHREIATRVGLSRSAAGARVQRLLAEGHIVVRGVVHPVVLGHRALAHVSLVVRGSAVRVAREVAAREDAAFVSLATGRYAVILELRAGAVTEIDEALGEVRAIDGVESTETLVYTEVVRDVAGPVGPVTAEIDDLDYALLSGLQEDGRASYVELAEAVGLSPAAARRRLVRLLSDNVVRVGAVLGHSGRGRRSATGVGLRLDGDHRDVAVAVAGLAAVTFVARTLGRYDAVLTVNTATSSGLVEVLDELRGLPGVREAESWSHLQFVKEAYASLHLGESSSLWVSPA